MSLLLRVKHAWLGHPVGKAEWRGGIRWHCRECGKTGESYWGSSAPEYARVGETIDEWTPKHELKGVAPWQ